MTGPSSERTADADVVLINAVRALSQLLCDEKLPGSPLTAKAADRLAALVARNQQLQEALAALIKLKDGPRDDDYERRKPDAWAEARAALASVRARTP